MIPAPPDATTLPAAWACAVADFVEALRVEAGLARNTLAAYGSDLARFARWAAAAGRSGWGAVEPDDVVAWLGSLRAAGQAEASIARRLVAVRMCLRHQVAEGRLAKDPASRIPSPLLARALPRSLGPDDVDALLTAPRGDGWLALRDRALLEVLYACGARVSEAVRLRLDELEPRLRVLRLVGKGSKTRIVPLGERAQAALGRWIAEGRPRVAGANRPPQVFLTKSGRPLDRTTAWRRVKAAAALAGILIDVSPHTLRHSFASHLIEGGADLRSVQEMLGHASIRTTEVYTHLDAEHVRSIHRLYHPRG